MQKKAIRIITNSTYNAHTSPLFKKLKILPFEKLLESKKILFMHKIINNTEHSTLQQYWKYNTDRNIGIELRNNLDITIPAPRFNGFKRFPPHDFAKAWNSVGDMRYQTNFSIFKHWLTDNLFTQIYSDD